MKPKPTDPYVAQLIELPILQPEAIISHVAGYVFIQRAQPVQIDVTAWMLKLANVNAVGFCQLCQIRSSALAKCRQ